jgi:hypothetical protein
MLAAGLPFDPLTALARHPQFLLVVVGGAVWLFKRALAIAAANRPPRGEPGEAAEAAARVGSWKPPGGAADAGETDEAEAERTRQVQAEVRRKIAERRSRPVAPPLVAPRPIAQPLSPPFGWPLGRGARPESVTAPRPAAPAQPVVSAPALAPPMADRSLSADVVARNARAFAAATAASAAAPSAPAGAALAAELREPNAARRAMLLREILGPPVALR